MARNIETILQQEIDEKEDQAALDGLNSTSKTAIWRLLLFVHAAAINLLEQVWDIFRAEIEDSIETAGAGSAPWLRERILEFQEGDDVEYNNGVIAYPIVDTTKRIITRCSITQDGNRVVKAKVAKSDPPEPLDSDEQKELRFYLDQIKFAGTQINVISLNPDRLYVNAMIEYDGQYAAVIQSNVETALTNYCTNLSSIDNFNGIVENNAVVDAVQKAPGVKRVKINEIAIRQDDISFSSRNKLFDLSAGIDSLKLETNSGYIIPEDDSGHTFADSITYTAV